MAVLPADNTARVAVRYTSGGFPHAAMLRPMVWSGPSTANTIVNALADLIKDFLPATDSVFEAFYCIPHSNVTVPVTFTPITGVSTAAGFAEDPESAFYSFCGKDTTSGKRWRLEIFTPRNLFSSWPPDNRYNPGDNAGADTVLARVKGLIEPGDDSLGVGTIAGHPIVMNNYINIAKNGYWQRKQRV